VLDPPNNPPSHYGACHFGYNIALREGNRTFEVEHAVGNLLMYVKI